MINQFIVNGTLIEQLLSLFIFWMFFNIFGLTTYIQPEFINKYRDLKIRFKSVFKSTKTFIYQLTSFIIEIFGIFLLTYSFFIPWIRLVRGGLYPISFYLNFIDAYYYKTFVNLVFYAFFVSLLIILIKISSKIKIRLFSFFELTEILLFLPGLYLIFEIRTLPVRIMTPLYLLYLNSYSVVGFSIFSIGLITLIINGLQISTYIRLKRYKNKKENNINPN
ncbi:MAG: hypothetical protein P8Y70_13885 [Candidatus Lokiarchaeota archaeon]